jgi:nitrogen-specific signal transduction histidine kinase
MLVLPSLLLLVSALLIGVLAVYAWHHRSTGPVTGYAACFLAAIALYVGGYAMELGAMEIGSVLFWVRVEYLGIAVIPPLVIGMVLEYTGQGRYLTRSVRAALYVIPGITLVLVLTMHPLHYATVGLDTGGAVPRFTFAAGPWYYVNALYALVAEMAAVVLLALASLRSAHAIHRQQILILLIGAFFPIAAHIAYLAGLSPVPRIDLTPFALPVTAAAFTVGVVLYQLFDLAPVVHSTVCERIPIGVVVVNGHGQVTEANPAATVLLGLGDRSPVGLPIEKAARRFPALPGLMGTAGDRETEVHDPDRTCTALVSTVPLADGPNRTGGTVLLISDVTARRRAEEALARRSADLEAANRRLSLLATFTRHDLANHLVALDGYLSLLREEPRAPGAPELLERLASVVDRVRVLSAFMRDYPAIGVQPPVWLELGATAERAARSVGLGDVAVDNRFPAAAVLADPLLERVFAALIENAVRHGGVTKVLLGAVPSDDGLVLVVEDDGAGVPRPDKERIFERGFGRNTGLGLFLAREILESMEMTIAETGVPSHGARFEIRIPGGRVRRTAGIPPEGAGPALALRHP